MRVLFVSTYEKMKREVERLRQEFGADEIDMIDLQSMSRKEAVEYIEKGECELVITRGGAYRFMKENTNKPVIPIDVTVYDILNILDFSQIQDTLLAGFAETMEYAAKMNELTNLKLNILALNQHEELKGKLEEIRSYKYVYTDYNSYVYLQQQGIACSLIESSYESIKEAYVKAENLYHELQELRRQEHILNAYLLDENKNVYLYEGKELYIKRITNPLFQSEIEQQIEKGLDSFIHGRYQEKCIYKNEYLIRIYNHHFKADGKKLTAIKVNFVKYSKKLADMTYQMKEVSNYYMAESELEQLDFYAASSLPVIIASLDEVLKRKAFQEMIEHSAYGDSTPFYIRFDMYTEKEIKKLFEDENSVLNLVGHVIILEEVESLSQILRKQLRNYFLDSRILASNKVIVSVRRQDVLREIFDAVPYQYVYVSSYCEQSDKKSIIERNLTEYEMEITEEKILALEGRKFVTEMDLKRVLANGAVERKNRKGQENTGGMLAQVQREYVLQVLQEEKGNRTRAAKRLGIGRTTLWRILNQD